MFIADGIPKLDEEIRRIFPRNAFNQFKNKWSQKYPRYIKWRRSLVIY